MSLSFVKDHSGAIGFGGDNKAVGILFLEPVSGAGDGAASADAGHKHVHPGQCVYDLIRRGFVMGLRVDLVCELRNEERKKKISFIVIECVVTIKI